MAAPADTHVQALARGLDVITAFDAEHPAMSLSQVAARAGLNRATARRFLHTLAGLGYVHVAGQRFSLTPRVLRLGTAYLSGFGLPEVAQPHLTDLSARIGESASVAVRDGADAVYVARAATRRIMTIGISVGTRLPLYATSLGRVLLAGLTSSELEDYLASAHLRALTPTTVTDADRLRDLVFAARRDGFALVDSELEAGLRSIAAPIRCPGRGVVAALNIATLSGVGRPVQEHRELVIAVAAAISDDLARVEGVAPSIGGSGSGRAGTGAVGSPWSG